jgi:transposase InsO family protein
MWGGEAPSITAASKSSRGSVRKNWRSRKMPKALPKNAGTVSGRRVLIQPMARNRMKVGIRVTWLGTIIVARKMMNRTFLPRKRSRAKA